MAISKSKDNWFTILFFISFVASLPCGYFFGVYVFKNFAGPIIKSLFSYGYFWVALLAPFVLLVPFAATFWPVILVNQYVKSEIKNAENKK